MDLHFDPLQYRYPSRRRLVYGRRGMVCASQPLAAQAGLDMIKKAETPLTQPWPQPPVWLWWSPCPAIWAATALP